MRTIRICAFETNSSSCHVITLMTDVEMERLKNKDGLAIFIPSIEQDDAGVMYNSEIVCKDRMMEIVTGWLGKDKIDTHRDQISKLLDMIIRGEKDSPEYQEVLFKTGMSREVIWVFDSIAYHFRTADEVNLTNDVQVKEINGGKIYCAFYYIAT